MRYLGTVVGAAALLVTAACAQPQETAGFGGHPPAPPASSAPEDSGGPAVGAHPPEGGTAIADRRVNDASLPKDQPHLVWTQGDGSVLGVYGKEGGCTKSHPELAEQSDKTVHVVVVEVVPAEKKICTMDLRYPPLTVQLAKPLGDRAVVLSGRVDTA